MGQGGKGKGKEEGEGRDERGYSLRTSIPGTATAKGLDS